MRRKGLGGGVALFLLLSGLPWGGGVPAGAQRKPSFLGLEVEDSAPTLEAMEEHEGVKVTRVVENSPAQAAGIEKGDIIVTLGGRSYRWPRAFQAAAEALAPGVPVKVELLREDVGLEVTVTPVERVAPARPEKVLYLAETRRVGIRVRTLARAAARRAGIPEAEGVELVGFWGKSPWQRDGLRAGDILHTLDGTPLHDPRELIGRVRKKRPGDACRLGVVRGGKRLTIRTVASRRARRTERVFIPILFNYTSPSPEKSAWGVLLDIFQTEWDGGRRTTTLFWVISWTTGEANRLEEIPVPAGGVEP